VLVDRGPYSLTRNPLNLFRCLAFIGAGLNFESITLTALLGLVFFANHWPTIHAEKNHLRSLFGAGFNEYAARVTCFLPRFTDYRRSELLEIRPRIFTRTLFEASLIPLVYLANPAMKRGHEIGVLPTFVRIY